MRKLSALALLLLVAVFLVSCSGVPGGGCVTNCGGGNATVSLVLTATPPNPTALLSIQSFTANITGVSLSTATGSVVAVPLNATTYIADFNRVTSDSTILAAKATVPADTYTTVTVTFSNPRVTFCTQTNPGVFGCAAGSVQSLTGSAGSSTISTSLTLAANQQTGVDLDLDLGAVITLNGQAITAINLGASGAFSAASLPPSAAATDLPAGALSHIDDVLGVVSAASSPSLTIQTATRGSITAVTNSSTQYSTNCSSQNFSCVQTGTAAIVDTVLNSDGTFTVVYYQPLASASLDIVEGVVTGVPNTTTQQCNIVVTDATVATSNSLISGQLSIGDQLTLSLSSSPQAFVIISKDLLVPTNTFAGATDVSAIQPGQTIAFPVISFSPQSGVTPGTASTDTVALRFTRLSGVMTSPSSPVFSADTFPSFFGLASARQFQTTTGRLSVDGASSLSGISSGTIISTTALYVGPSSTPTFTAQTVRAH